MTFATAGSSFDTLLAVYTGTNIANLTPVAGDDDQGGFGTSSVTFRAEDGVEYQIAVDGFAGASGEIVLSWQFSFGIEEVPQILTAPQSQAVIIGANVTFTVLAAAQSALGYQWFYKDNPLAGATAASVTLSNVQPAAAGLYTVGVSSSTRTVTSPPAVLEIGAAPNVTSQDKFSDLFPDPPQGVPLQTLLARRKTSVSSVAAGVLGTQVLDNFGAGKELDEPNHAGVIGGASRWFRLRAEDDGVMVCDTIGSSIDTVVGVYTGTNLLELRLVASDDNSAPDGIRSQVRFPAVRGGEYLVAVDGVRGAQGNVKLNWGLGIPPAITREPADQAAIPGSHVTLAVLAGGTPAPSYQWLFNGFELSGATNALLSLDNVQLAHAGSYKVMVRNFAGTTTSRTAGIIIGAEPLQFSAWSLTANRSFQLTLTGGGTTARYLIEASTNLLDWLPVSTSDMLNNRIDFLDPDSTNYSLRFYRALPAR